jgi:protein-disulfide isomerase
MLGWRSLGALFLVALTNLKVTTCQSPAQRETGNGQAADPAPTNVDLPGIDASSLTTREKQVWSEQVSELLTPCPAVAVSLVQCIKEKRACAACVPAAEFVLRQVRQGKVRSQVEAAYRARFAPEAKKEIEIGDSPAKGPPNAPVVIVEFADFECPACAAAMPLLDKLYEAHPNKLRVVFKNFPLSTHPNAEIAARAAVAAHRQGKFWEMHDRMFEAGAPLDRPRLERIARDLGLDVKKFVAALESEEVVDRVALDRKQGDHLEISGTPTLFINGRRYEPSVSEIEEWVALELRLTSKHAQNKVTTGQAAPEKSAQQAAPENKGKE